MLHPRAELFLPPLLLLVSSHPLSVGSRKEARVENNETTAPAAVPDEPGELENQLADLARQRGACPEVLPQIQLGQPLVGHAFKKSTLTKNDRHLPGPSPSQARVQQVHVVLPRAQPGRP